MAKHRDIADLEPDDLDWVTRTMPWAMSRGGGTTSVVRASGRVPFCYHAQRWPSVGRPQIFLSFST